MGERKMIVYMTAEPEKIIAKKYVSIKEGAELFSFGRNTFANLVKEANAGYKVGNRVLINVEELDAYLQKYKVVYD